MSPLWDDWYEIPLPTRSDYSLLVEGVGDYATIEQLTAVAPRSRWYRFKQWVRLAVGTQGERP